MKNGTLLLIPIALTASWLSMAQTASAPAVVAKSTHTIVRRESVQWTPFLPGVERAVISGDPDKAGELFVIWVRSADGSRVPPHWHPQDEHITVLQGTLVLGVAEKFDLSAAHELPAGTYAFMPKETRHFAVNKGETIFQVYGIGPFKTIFVNPEDASNYRAKSPKQ